jgi:hypothetical protein
LQFFRDQEKHFEGFTVKNILRNDNSDADELAKAAAQNKSLPQDVFYQILKQASIKAVQAQIYAIKITKSKCLNLVNHGNTSICQLKRRFTNKFGLHIRNCEGIINAL